MRSAGALRSHNWLLKKSHPRSESTEMALLLRSGGRSRHHFGVRRNVRSRRRIFPRRTHNAMPVFVPGITSCGGRYAPLLRMAIKNGQGVLRVRQACLYVD